MTVAAKWLRRFEIALIVAGISSTGGAFASTARRRQYQTRKERTPRERYRAPVARYAFNFVGEAPGRFIVKAAAIESPREAR